MDEYEAILGTHIFVGCNDLMLFCSFQGLYMSVLWVLYFGILSCQSPTYIWIIILRCMVGFGIGGAPQAYVPHCI